ncbi:gas vesicle protein GvpJ [Rhodococcus pyridinivorans]|uniref:gas vesicle protein GvpJ n=1 Tax=Rhodococcus pyridinivorans TaxID=103816 RepID=UPI000BA26969|nr:gas vesicle protein GvpJ [Rhodococcus pyridinivorans]
MTVVGGGGGMSSPQPYGGGGRSTNLGDIQVNLLDIELLTIKLRLVIASLETAKAVGIDWWESDPWLTSKARAPEVDSSRVELELENRQLRERLAALEARAEELESEPAEIVDEENRD